MIGFFDSGLGGLSILKEAVKLLPDHDFAYIGDEVNCPWGDKPREFIIERSILITEKLLSMGSKAIVVACNTATVNAISCLREKFASVPFVGVEPGVKPAATNTNTGKIAILATKATSLGSRFLELVNLFASDKDVKIIPAPDLVELIEQGQLEGDKIESLLTEILTKESLNGADQLVLGCTHYPFVIHAIRKVVGDRIQIIDTAPAVARQLERIVTQFSIKHGQGDIRLYTSGNFQKFYELATRLLGIEQLKVESILLP
jgi:glutamate racemase